MKIFCYFCISYSLCFIKKSVFVVLLYKALVEFLSAPPIWENFLAGLVVFDNLQEVFGFSIVTNFMSIMFGFSIVFGCRVIVICRGQNNGWTVEILVILLLCLAEIVSKFTKTSGTLLCLIVVRGG